MCYYFIIICLDLRIGNKTKDSRIITIQRRQRKGLLERGKKKKKEEIIETLRLKLSDLEGLDYPKHLHPKKQGEIMREKTFSLFIQTTKRGIKEIFKSIH